MSRRAHRAIITLAALVAIVLGASPALAQTSTAATTATAATAAVPLSPAGSTSPPGTARPPRLTSGEVTEIARTSRRAQAWIADHPITRTPTPVHDAEKNLWTQSFVDADDTTQAQVLVDDTSGAVVETRIGPQVSWQMARGYKGAFGRSLTEPQIWIPLFVLFLVPLIRWRRFFSWHTLDLTALAAFGLSLAWFNRGEIFTAVPLAYPPMVYLAVRLAWVGLRRPLRRGDAGAPDAGAVTVTSARPRAESWCPTWLLFALLLLVLGLRLGLNAFDSNVIDVGYAGVIGGDRITHGITPYGTFPNDCSQCDTYGPVVYLAYAPFEAIAPWTGTWNGLDAAHAAAVSFDLFAIAGLMLLGWRIGGRKLAVLLGFAWTAYPFSAYTLESNSNDSLIAAILIWGLVWAHRPFVRGVAAGLAALSKFTPAILLVLWARSPYPRQPLTPRRLWSYVGGLAVALVGTGWIILLDGTDGIHAFWSRTLGFQFGRKSPFSIWGQHPELRPVQLALSALVVIAAVAFIRWPRTLDLRSFAALSGLLLLGIQLSLTHWFYLYIPWFLPFAIVALIPIWTRREEIVAVPGSRPTPVPSVFDAHVRPAGTGG